MTEYIDDWSSVPDDRYRQAQAAERRYWREQDPLLLLREANYNYYAGYYEWIENNVLLNPFGCARPGAFEIAGDAMEGRTVVDLGCGPISASLSLVHCAGAVYAVDPLADFYRDIQPFGWECFRSVSAVGAEEVPLESESFDFVYCWNTLDHVMDADRVLREAGRLLRTDGRFLLGCHVRAGDGGGPPHPYKWDIETFEARVFAEFAPVRAPVLLDDSLTPVPREGPHSEPPFWVCCLRSAASGH